MENSTKFCHRCGHPVPKMARFCSFCSAGQSLDAATLPPTDVPYNETAHPELLDSGLLYFRDSFKLNKRLGRADFWWSKLYVLTIHSLSGIVFALLFGLNEKLELESGDSYVGWVLIILVIYLVFFLIAGLTAEARRLHDIGLSGTHLVLHLIPLIGTLVLLFFCIQPSKQFGNRYVA